MPGKILIIGAGTAGKLVLEELQKDPSLPFSVEGFLDDDPDKKGSRIGNIEVIGKISEARKLVQTRRIDEIIIAIPSAKGSDKRRILEQCTIPGVRLKVLPGIFEILRGNVQISQLRDPLPEDLIGRKLATFDPLEVKPVFQGKTVLITGGAGSIGTELFRKLLEVGPKKILLLDVDENGLYFNWVEAESAFPAVKVECIVCNIREAEKVSGIFSTHRPDIIFHAAASKQVPIVENNTAEAVKNNVFGTQNVLEAAIQSGAERFVLISTDKAVSPSSMMGSTKRIAEWVCQRHMNQSRTRVFVARFGNVFGSKGSVIPLFMKQISEKKEITITDKKMTRYFMSLEEAVALLLKVCSMEKSGVYYFDMGEQIPILDIGIELIKLHGLKPYEEVKIREIGLRPGEKISEILITENETKRSSPMKNIMEVIPGKNALTEVERESKRILQRLLVEKELAVHDSFERMVKPVFEKLEKKIVAE